MDWQDKEQISPRVTWQYTLCTFVSFCLVAALVSYSIGSPDKAVKSSDSDQSGLVSISLKKDGVAASLELPPEFHPWGAFESGTWCLSRTIVEGRRLGRISPKTYMESNVILMDKQKNIYTTMTESSILLAGKNIQKEPKIAQTDIFGLPADGSRRVEELPSETLTIEGVPVVCRVLKIVSVSGRYLREIQVWFNETTEPYVFRKVRSTYRIPSNVRIERMVQNVTSAHLQFSLAGKVMTGYRYSQTSDFLTYVSKSEVVASLAVPGRIVTQITRESDHRGRPLQDVSTELIDFGSSAEEYQSRVSRGSVHSNRLIITPTDSEKTEEAGTGTTPETPEKNDLSSQKPAMGGQRHISVEFSLSSEDDPVEESESVPDAEKSILESDEEPEPMEEPEVTPATTDSVKLEDLVSLQELTAISQNPAEADAGIIPVSGGLRRMEPGIFREFQVSWQIGNELLKPNSHVEIGRLFPHLSGAKWGRFLQNRNLLPSVFQKIQRSDEKTQMEPEDF